jgi:uncharacterized tellurite resistance protein B-like protein
MGRLYELQDHLLADGKITQAEVDVIREYVDENGQLDLDDVKLLVTVLSEAREVCKQFDDLLFPVLKKVLLADGQIAPDEQFYLLKMLYSDGHLRESEKRFLRELRSELATTTPEFDRLCETALAAPAKGWSVK